MTKMVSLLPLEGSKTTRPKRNGKWKRWDGKRQILSFMPVVDGGKKAFVWFGNKCFDKTFALFQLLGGQPKWWAWAGSFNESNPQ
jgi:hypothetical protein